MLECVAKARTQDIKFSITAISQVLKICRSRFYSKYNSRSLERELDHYEVIKEVFDSRRGKIGIRQLKMLIFRRYKICMNLKKIARIKNKYGLVTKIRRKNLRYKFKKLQQEHKVGKNILERNFSGHDADKVYSTDITQFNIPGLGKAYLAAVKDLGTKEVRGFAISKTLHSEIVLEATSKAIKRISVDKRKELIVHSDQGFQFTHYHFRRLLEDHGITQSMSRKGNCLDNAPIESFFGHLKDHIELKGLESFEEFKELVTKEILYYNNERPQWDLKKMPPTSYRRHLSKPGLF